MVFRKLFLLIGVILYFCSSVSTAQTVKPKSGPANAIRAPQNRPNTAVKAPSAANVNYCAEAARIIQTDYRVSSPPPESCRNVSMDFPALIGALCENYPAAAGTAGLNAWFQSLKDMHAFMTCLSEPQFTIADRALERSTDYLYDAFPDASAVKAAQALANAQFFFTDVNPLGSRQRAVWSDHAGKLDALSAQYSPGGIWVWNFIRDNLEFYSFAERRFFNSNLKKQKKPAGSSETQNSPSPTAAAISPAKPAAPALKEKLNASRTGNTPSVMVYGSPPEADSGKGWMSRLPDDFKLPETLQELVELYLSDVSGGKHCPSLNAALMVTGGCCSQADCRTEAFKNTPCCQIQVGGNMGSSISPMDGLIGALGEPSFGCLLDATAGRGTMDPGFGQEILDKQSRLCQGKTGGTTSATVGAAFGAEPFLAKGVPTHNDCGGDTTGMSDKPPPKKPESEPKNSPATPTPKTPGSQGGDGNSGTQSGSQGNKPSMGPYVQDPPKKDNANNEPRGGETPESFKVPDPSSSSSSGSGSSNSGGSSGPDSSGGSGSGSPQAPGTSPSSGDATSGGASGSSGGSEDTPGRGPGQTGEDGSSSGSSGNPSTGSSSNITARAKKTGCPPSSKGKTNVKGAVDIGSAMDIATHILLNDPNIRQGLQEACGGCGAQDVSSALLGASQVGIFGNKGNCSERKGRSNYQFGGISVYVQNSGGTPCHANLADLAETILHEQLHWAQYLLGIERPQTDARKPGPFNHRYNHDAQDYNDSSFFESHALITQLIDNCKLQEGARGGGGGGIYDMSDGEGDGCGGMSAGQAAARRKLICSDSMKPAQARLEEVNERIKKFTTPGGASNSAMNRSAAHGNTPTPEDGSGADMQSCAGFNYAQSLEADSLANCGEGSVEIDCSSAPTRPVQNVCGEVNCGAGRTADPSQDCRCVGPTDLNTNRPSTLEMRGAQPHKTRQLQKPALSPLNKGSPQTKSRGGL